MSWTTTKIRDAISGIGRFVIFTTRDMLGLGSRVSVDKTLQNLVKVGVIHRVVQGVFIREMREISLEEIAQVKLRSFKKIALTHPADELAKRGYGKGNAEPTFVTDGCKSSFKFLVTGERIYIKKVCQRKISLGDTRAGKWMRALWYKHVEDEKTAFAMSEHLNRADRKEIYNSYAALPGWLNDTLNFPILERAPVVRESTPIYEFRTQPGYRAG